MPGFHSDLSQSKDYCDLPERIDEDELERRVIALRAGDMSQVNPISMSLLRLVMSLVQNFAHPRRTPDLIGTALLTLVESVTNAATQLNDNNIVPYVSVSVSMRLKDAIGRDHVVCVPPRQLRRLRAKGIEVTVPITADVVDVIAKPFRPSLECTEILSKIAQCRHEQILIELRSQQHSLAEIANVIGCSIGTVHRMKMDLRARFSTLNDI